MNFTFTLLDNVEILFNILYLIVITYFKSKYSFYNNLDSKRHLL